MQLGDRHIIFNDIITLNNSILLTNKIRVINIDTVKR